MALNTYSWTGAKRYLRIIEMPGSPNELPSIYYGLLIIGGHVLLPLLFTTLLVSTKVKRHPTIINFCMTGIIYSVSYSLPLYRGQDGSTISEHSLCVAQLGMTNGSDTMVGAANLVLTIQVWSTFYAPWKVLCISRYRRSVRLFITLAPPYIVFLTFGVVGMLEAMHYSEYISIDKTILCTLNQKHFSRLTLPVVCGMFLLGASVFEAAVIIRWYSIWRAARRACPDAYINHLSLSPCVRVGIFLGWSWVTISLCLFVLVAFGSTNAYLYIVKAALPLVAFIVFGMQADIALVWLPCLKGRPLPATVTTETRIHSCERAHLEDTDSIFEDDTDIPYETTLEA